jgi:formylmethanofuran dehydrogenase subunit D
VFVTANTGDLPPKVNNDFKINSNTGLIEVVKANTTGNADGTTIYVPNARYGTAAAPSTSGLPHGTLYFKHSA